MKNRLQTPDPAKAYIAALYAHNRLRFAAAAALAVASHSAELFLSWALGAVVDAIAGADAGALIHILRVTVVFVAGIEIVELLGHWLRADFLRRAGEQYKNAAYAALCRKSIGAFGGENTGRYIALLTADAEKVQENYLNAVFWLLPQPFLVLGSLWMMLRLSPALTLATVLFGSIPVAGAALLAPALARRERAQR